MVDRVVLIFVTSKENAETTLHEFLEIIKNEIKEKMDLELAASIPVPKPPSTLIWSPGYSTKHLFTSSGAFNLPEYLKTLSLSEEDLTLEELKVLEDTLLPVTHPVIHPYNVELPDGSAETMKAQVDLDHAYLKVDNDTDTLPCVSMNDVEMEKI